MEIVIAVEILRRRRILLGLGILLSVVLGAAGAGILPPHSAAKTPASGQALTEVVIDTHIRLAATTKPGGDATIVQRAVFLADLLQSKPMTTRIANAIGQPAWQVTVLGPVLPPASEFSLFPDGQLPVVAAAASQTAVHTPYVVQLMPSYTVPIVQIGTVAPTAHAAVVLAQATVEAMKAAVQPSTLVATAPLPKRNSHGAVKPAAAPDEPPLRIDQLGAVSSVAIPPKTVHALTGLLAAIGSFIFWCFAVVIAGGARRAWRGTPLRRPADAVPTAG
jgi:hypothetical protein